MIADNVATAQNMTLSTSTREDIDVRTRFLIGYLNKLQGEYLGEDEDEEVLDLFRQTYMHLELSNRPRRQTPSFTAFTYPPAPGSSHEQRYKEVTTEFSTSSLPPMMTGHWLMKCSQASRDRSWTDPSVAVEWLTKRYVENPPFERDPEARTYVGLEDKRDHALRTLTGGKDVSWVYYTRSGNILSLSVVCCPNSLHPRLSCPLAHRH